MSGSVIARSTWFATVLALSLAGACAAQRTWVVDSRGGPGVDFTELPPALAASSSGDTILLRRGTGAPYRFGLPSVAVGQGIRIVGDDIAPVPVEGVCHVRGLPDGELFVIHNVDVTARGAVPAGIIAEDSGGLVLVSGLVDGLDFNGGQAALRSSRVIYTGCRMITPYQSLIIQDSGVWLIDCDIRGPGPSAVSYLPGAVNVRDSELWVVGSYVKGPDGVGNDCGVTLAPEEGILVDLSRVVLCGGTRIEGGYCASARLRAPAFYQRGHTDPRLAGWHVRDPNVSFVDEGPVRRDVPVLHREVPAVFPRAASPGQRQTIDVIGTSNGIVSVYASFAHGYAPIRLPVGDVWLDPALTLHVSTGAVDPQRRYQATTTIPFWLPVGSTLVYQAVALTSSGRFELSTPGFAVVQ